MVRSFLPPITHMLFKSLLVHKSNAFFCPLYRHSSLCRPRLIIFPFTPNHMPVLTCFFSKTCSPTPLPIIHQLTILPIPPYHLMPPPTSLPLPRTNFSSSHQHVCLSLQTLRPQHTNHLNLHWFLCRIQYLHILLSFQSQHSLSHVHSLLVIPHLAAFTLFISFQITNGRLRKFS